MLKRHAVHVLTQAGHTQAEIAELTGLPERSVRRIQKEPEIEEVDDAAEHRRRGVGRPSKVEKYREFVVAQLDDDPELKSVEILVRARREGYDGGKSAFYDLVRSLRPAPQDTMVRFEGLPGEFTQHDFGEVKVRYLDGTQERVQFFASRLKYSRFSHVSLVESQQAETLVRELCDHFDALGGIPLLAVFDRPKTIAKSWKKNGEVTAWNPFFAHAAMELRLGVEVCWPRQPQQKGSVENLVGWVKGSFFKQRRFVDRDDLVAQLAVWLHEVNHERKSRATGKIPAMLRGEEEPRLRPPRVTSKTLGLPIPVHVGPTGVVVFEGREYSMPAEAMGYSGTLYLYPDRVRIVAGRFTAEHPRLYEPKAISRLPEHRADRLAKVSGSRGRLYLKRQDLLELGSDAMTFLTEIVHQHPKSWRQHVEELWDALQLYGSDAMRFAIIMANAEQRFDAHVVLGHLAVTTQGRLL